MFWSNCGADCGRDHGLDTCSTVASARPCSVGIPRWQTDRNGRLNCFLQEVLVSACKDSSAARRWVGSRAHLLYVEVRPGNFPNSRDLAHRSETGILFEEKQEKNNFEQTWVFGASQGADGEQHNDCSSSVHIDHLSTQIPGEKFSFDIPRAKGEVELVISVFRSHATWHLAFGMRAPLELVGEASFRALVGKSENGRSVDRQVPLYAPGGKEYVLGHVAITTVPIVFETVDGTALPEPGSFQVCDRPDDLSFFCDASHPEWKDIIIISQDGRFRRFSGDAGKWVIQGNVLCLCWDVWEHEHLRTDDQGITFRNAHGFRLHSRKPPAWFTYFFQLDGPGVSFKPLIFRERGLSKGFRTISADQDLEPPCLSSDEERSL